MSHSKHQPQSANFHWAACQPGQYLSFGHYLQSKSDIPEPIEWLVLAREAKALLVIAKHSLDCRSYHDPKLATTWEECTLRHWLNTDFMQTAFTAKEREFIQFSHLYNGYNIEYETDGGNDTEDQLFCLSIDEAAQYLMRGSSRTAERHENYSWFSYSDSENALTWPTEYAKSQGAWVNVAGNSWSWLRSPGCGNTRAACLSYHGQIYLYGNTFCRADGCIRPAMRLICE